MKQLLFYTQTFKHDTFQCHILILPHYITQIKNIHQRRWQIPQPKLKTYPSLVLV